MIYVYLLESVSLPGQFYVGLTDDLRARLAAHNAGQSPHGEIQAVAPCHLCRVLGQSKSGCLRTLPEDRVRKGLCKKASAIMAQCMTTALIDSFAAVMAKMVHDRGGAIRGKNAKMEE